MNTNKNGFDQKKLEEQRFEFVLYINNNIICQRYFNVRDYNEDAIHSWELKQLMDNICGMNNGEFGSMGIIPNHLKNKSKAYLWANYNPYLEEQPVVEPKNLLEKVNNFQFEIRVDRKTIAKSMFMGNYFPIKAFIDKSSFSNPNTKVRYVFDIKEIIPDIMSEIRNGLSQKKYTRVTA